MVFVVVNLNACAILRQNGFLNMFSWETWSIPTNGILRLVRSSNIPQHPVYFHDTTSIITQLPLTNLAWPQNHKVWDWPWSLKPTSSFEDQSIQHHIPHPSPSKSACPKAACFHHAILNVDHSLSFFPHRPKFTNQAKQAPWPYPTSVASGSNCCSPILRFLEVPPPTATVNGCRQHPRCKQLQKHDGIGHRRTPLQTKMQVRLVVRVAHQLTSHSRHLRRPHCGRWIWAQWWNSEVAEALRATQKNSTHSQVVWPHSPCWTNKLHANQDQKQTTFPAPKFLQKKKKTLPQHPNQHFPAKRLVGQEAHLGRTTTAEEFHLEVVAFAGNERSQKPLRFGGSRDPNGK